MKKKQIYWHYPHLLFLMGGTKYLIKVSKELSSTYNVCIITNVISSDVKAEFLKNDVRYITTSVLSTNNLLYWAFFPFFILFDTIKSLKYLKMADIILCTSFPSNFIAYINKIIYKKDFFYLCYEPFPFFYDSTYQKQFGLFKQQLLKFLSLIYSWMDYVAASSSKEIMTLDKYKASLIENAYNRRPIIVGIGIDTLFFSHKEGVKKLHDKYGTKNIILHSTDYSPLKATDVAIKSFKYVVKKHSDAVLVITSTQPKAPGKKDLLSLAERLKIENNIIHVGLLSKTELAEHYSAALCYLSTTNSPMTAGNWPVKESLASGTPAIRSKIATLDVIDNESGFLVEPTNLKKMAQKICFLIDSPIIAKKMGQFGRKTMLHNYSWEKVVDTISGVIDN